MPNRAKILLVTTKTLGGVGEHLLALARGLNRERYDVTIAFSPGEPLDAEFDRAGVRVVHMPLQRDIGLRASVAGFFKLATLMRRERFDLVHTNTAVAGAVGRVAAWATRMPVVVHMVHAYAGHPHVRPWKRRAYTTIEQLLKGLTDYFIVGSDAMLRAGVERGVVRPTHVRRIYNAIDLRAFDERARGSRNLRDELSLPHDATIVGLVGRLEPQKGVEFLLEAAAALKDRRPNLRVLVVGEGPLRAALESHAADLGLRAVVHFVGWRRDVAVVMRTIDILAVPSRWEAFGLVNIEAMSARKPVVAFAVEGIPEVVEDGVTGLLVRPGDTAHLVTSLDRLIADPALRARMGEAGRRRVEAHFSTEVMIRAHEELFEELLARHSGAPH